MVTAKFKVTLISDYGSYRQITMSPVYSPDKASPNYSWSQATPCGELKMTITNPNAFNQFGVGKSYLMTFTETGD